MARSIRISDELHALAAAEAQLTNRSLAQQLAHWATLGLALDRSGLASLDDVQAAVLRLRHAAHEAEVTAGHRSSLSLHVIPKKMVKGFKMVFPEQAFQDGTDEW